MSKRRNRSVRTLPSTNLLYYHPLPELVQQSSDVASKLSPEKRYFGEYIQERRKEEEEDKDDDENIATNREEKMLNPSSDDSIILDINSLALSKSSSSSISWNDEYRNEAQKKVEEELLKMENILRGFEPIPSNYDANEYKEWMETFPNLCVVGTSINYSSSSYYEPFDDDDDEEELIAIHPANSDCDIFQTSNTSDLNELKEQIKKAVIERIFNNISGQLKSLKCKHQQIEKKNLITNNTKVISDNNNNNNSDKLAIDVDNYLKISPITQYNHPRYLNERRPSSKALISSQISSSKWLKDESPEYLSLPFLADNFNNSSLYFNRHNLSVTNKNVQMNNASKSSTIAQRKLLNSIVLPPIDVSSQFRSISATPRRNVSNNKCLSALSMKWDRDFYKKSSANELKKCYEFPKRPPNRRLLNFRFSLCED